MGRKRDPMDGVVTTTTPDPPPAAPLKPLGAAAITPAEASPPDPTPGTPPKGIPPELWEYCQFGERIRKRAKRDKSGVKKAAKAQLLDEPAFRRYGRLTAVMAHNVATRLKPQHWKRLGRVTFPEGRTLTRTHLQELTQRNDEKLIEELIRGLEREAWTSLQIRHKARAFKGKDSEDKPKPVRRPRTVPKNLAEGLESLVRHAEDWLKDYGPDALGRNKWLDGPAAVAGPEELMASLERAKDLLGRLVRAARKLETRVKKLEIKVPDGGKGSVP